MGRVRTKTVKRAAKTIIEKNYTNLSAIDFHTNKRVCDQVALIPTKRLRNKIAGFVTTLMKRIEKAPVRGISIKMQEEEREKRDNYVPDKSALEVEGAELDATTLQMLQSHINMDVKNLPAFKGEADKKDRTFRS